MRRMPSHAWAEANIHYLGWVGSEADPAEIVNIGLGPGVAGGVRLMVSR